MKWSKSENRQKMGNQVNWLQKNNSHDTLALSWFLLHYFEEILQNIIHRLKYIHYDKWESKGSVKGQLSCNYQNNLNLLRMMYHFKKWPFFRAPWATKLMLGGSKGGLPPSTSPKKLWLLTLWKVTFMVVQDENWLVTPKKARIWRIYSSLH